MTIYFIMAKVTVDDTNPNHPSSEDCVLAIENAVNTPDNDHFGVKEISVYQVAQEEK